MDEGSCQKGDIVGSKCIAAKAKPEREMSIMILSISTTYETISYIHYNALDNIHWILSIAIQADSETTLF